ncbi:hypothetical protein OG523_04350 [Streptomyces virginiae]|uniref:hypothetical protein n=1 Tax=Streptomyces virginiae TaxID=1961 RepID=UPI002259F007|nr:hypothetical protein [Streptomyces virginiae]MCX5175008.1 hypothetical protein [Streptomyces virginiae]
MITLVATIVLAFVGYTVTYLNGLRLAQRQERLSRVNRQLSELYGPLFALTEANSRIFGAFLERNARSDGRSPFVHELPPTEEELAEWRLWVKTVFLPNIQRMRDLVIKHADLLSESRMPPILLQLCAHVSGYEITVARWEQGSYGEHRSVVPFPSEEIAAYARHGFTGLKREQGRLLGRRRNADGA